MQHQGRSRQGHYVTCSALWASTRPRPTRSPPVVECRPRSTSPCSRPERGGRDTLLESSRRTPFDEVSEVIAVAVALNHMRRPIVAVRMACRVRSLRLRNLHKLRALPDVHQRHLLGSAGPHLLANHRHHAAKLRFSMSPDPIATGPARYLIKPLLRTEAWIAFEEWDREPDKITY
jgi:hypothetical protein